MTTKDILQETYSALSANKVRSGLTMLGIVIGISSVIAMTAIGNGAQASIESNIQAIGANLITVSPGASRGPGVQVSSGRGTAKSLTLADAEAIEEKIPNIKAVSAEVSGRYQVVSKSANTNTSVVGVRPTYAEVRNIEIEEGNFITTGQNISGAKVVVIGPSVRDDLLGVGADAIGVNIRIKQVQFKIVGVTKSKGGTGFNNPDEMMYIPLTTAQRYFSGDEYLTSISISANDADVTTQVQADIKALLLDRHNIDDEELADFSTFNQADIIATASTITSTLTILLSAVAGISLIVGGIGIMNMMLTTVTERTREIGLRKAIGAKRKDISRQFLLEAVMLTFVGGALGIALGWLISFGVSQTGIIATKVSLSSVLLAFGVSTTIGIIFGYYPARKAAKLNPIDALRYE